MRRRALVGALSALVLVGLGGLAPHGTSVGQGVPWESSRTAGRHDQEALRVRIVEGRGPPIERLAPDALPTDAIRDATRDPAAPEGHSVAFRHYPRAGELASFLRDLEAAHPDLLHVLEIGRTSLGRPILAVRVTSELAGRPIDDRPAMYIDGQHHARELISQSVALYTVWWLVDRYESDARVRHMLDSRVLYVVPSVNPDGNDIVLADNQSMRKTANPGACDDDRDGTYDEDPTTGYGHGSHTLFLYRFQQAWADAHPDDPFVGDWRNRMVPANPIEELGRFTGAHGGPARPVPSVDDDEDGRVDEDEPGGADPNRNYDFQWQLGEATCRSDNYRGHEPFSEPEARAVRDLLASIDGLSTALSYHSGIDRILHPWGYSATADLPDAWLFELVGRKGSQLTEVNGFAGSPHTWTARGLYDATGSTMDYLYERHGVLAFSPEVYGGSGRTRLERLGATGTFTVGLGTSAVYNPPPDQILPTVDRWNRFAVYLMAATPNVELWSLSIADDHLILRVGNDGALPVDVRGAIVSASGRSIDLGPTRLAASSATWSVALAAVGEGPFDLTLEALQPTGRHPHAIGRARWRIEVARGGARLLEGHAGKPPELAEMFPDGWWADDRWDEPGRYHLPPDMPISVTPRPTPTPEPTPSTTPEPTPSTTPEPTPAATETAVPSPTGVDPSPTLDPTTAPPTSTHTATTEPSATPEGAGSRLHLPWAARSMRPAPAR